MGLRTLYLPGLQGLKDELRMMDWLMERLMPELKQHLDASTPSSPLLAVYPAQVFVAAHLALMNDCLHCLCIHVLLMFIPDFTSQ